MKKSVALCVSEFPSRMCALLMVAGLALPLPLMSQVGTPAEAATGQSPVLAALEYVALHETDNERGRSDRTLALEVMDGVPAAELRGLDRATIRLTVVDDIVTCEDRGRYQLNYCTSVADPDGVVIASVERPGSDQAHVQVFFISHRKREDGSTMSIHTSGYTLQTQRTGDAWVVVGIGDDLSAAMYIPPPDLDG